MAFPVFENNGLRKIFGPKRQEVVGEWRKLHHGELHNLCTSPSNVRIIKSRMMMSFKSGELVHTESLRLDDSAVLCKAVGIQFVL